MLLLQTSVVTVSFFSVAYFSQCRSCAAVMTIVLPDNPTHPAVLRLHLLLPQIVYLPTSQTRLVNQMAAAQTFHRVEQPRSLVRCTAPPPARANRFSKNFQGAQLKSRTSANTAESIRAKCESVATRECAPVRGARRGFIRASGSVII